MGRWTLGVCIVLAAVLVRADVAHACGGCFHLEGGTRNTQVTGHRMALSVSVEQTVLWDQIEYSGEPTEFSWVLPIKPGARLEISTDAWFEVLDAGTSVVVTAEDVHCPGDGSGSGGFTPPDYGSSGTPSYDGYVRGNGDDGSSFGCGCGSNDDETSTTTTTSKSASSSKSATSGGWESTGLSASTGTGMEEPPPPPDVTVVHEGTVGPYETVTLSTDIPGVLDDWLTDHGYNIPTDIQPVIDAYVAEGFDFIAMRLVPGNNVKAMKPVRVISPGASMALPLRMVAAGTGAKTALSLLIISEGRYQTQNFTSTLVSPGAILWDESTSSSNYSELRAAALAENNGHAWLTSYAKPDVLFSPELDNISHLYNVNYTGTTYSATTLADAYVQQGLENDETGDTSCLATFALADGFAGPVVDTCDAFGNCPDAPQGQLAAHKFACGPLDDLAVALIGLHPADVWITRLEAELPREALADDLFLEAAASQVKIENRILAPHKDDPCFGMAPIRIGRPPTLRLPPGGIVTLFLAAVALATLRRRPRLTVTA